MITPASSPLDRVLHPATVLRASALGLVCIGLGYGLQPGWYPAQYGYALHTVAEAHIFRALCGLYLALGLYWLWAAANPAQAAPALRSVCVVMAGLAGGRVVSLLLDGVPPPLLLVFLALEVVVASQALLALRRL